MPIHQHIQFEDMKVLSLKESTFLRIVINSSAVNELMKIGGFRIWTTHFFLSLFH